MFFDSTGRRRFIVSAVSCCACTLLGVLIVCLVATSVYGPTLSAIEFRTLPRALSSRQILAPASTGEPGYVSYHIRASTVGAANATARYAYLVNWDDNSFSSLKRNARSLDFLIVEWLHLGDPGEALQHDEPEKEALTTEWIKANAPDLKVLPLVNNYRADAARWDGAAAARMLSAKKLRAGFADELYQFVRDGGYAGAVLDLEEIPAQAQADYIKLVRELAAKFSGQDLRLLVAVPAEDPACDYLALANAADALILMTYDEHFEAGAPGPLASQGWFEATLDRRLKTIDPQKLIISVGSYGYDWSGTGKGQEISVQEAWELLEESHATLRFDTASLNPAFGYVDDTANKPHQVWYLDGVTAFNQITAALAVQPQGLALWRLGTEDPSIWEAFARGRAADIFAREATKTLHAGYDVLYKGKGEVLSVTGTLQEGARSIALDPTNNLIVDQEIVSFPKSTTITRQGARSDKVLALTFDDGPDRTYTPKVLDILAAKGVKATFFIVGSAGAVNGDVLKRIYEEGHDIGNHTFTHLNTANASSERLAFEINATQRLIEATVGARTKLFRPPYAQDLEPQTIDGAQALILAGSLGYLTIGMDIDPKDWVRPLAGQIVANTVNGAMKGQGNVILLHDAGGIRNSTVEALPQIIDKLQQADFRFMPLHELLGLARDDVMPRVGPEDALIVASNRAGFSLFRGMNSFLMLLFYAGITLGTVRLLWVASFAIVHARRERERLRQVWMPRSLAVLIPAFNEEKVICNSIHALLASRVRKFKIIVIDDGSSDATATVVRRTFGRTNRVIVLENSNRANPMRSITG